VLIPLLRHDPSIVNHRAETTTIRRLAAGDAPAAARLAQRDSSRVPAGPLLGAELDGSLVAAISTATRDVIADPFRRTAEIVELLRLRADQLEPRSRRGPGRARLAPSQPGTATLTLARQRGGR
jgi:hypothetical protein